jgi:protein-tyrosine phosphatase
MSASVLRVTVETDESGGLRVAWQLDGGDAAVDVGVGPTPNLIDHMHTVAVDAGTTSVRLAHPAPGRHFVSVGVRGSGSAVVAADRRLRFEGLQNFRDMGGYATGRGATTKWGQIFRADSLHKLTPADLLAFEHLGMKTVFDLRSDEEIGRHPNPLESIQLAIVGRPRAGDAPPSALEGLDAGSDGERMLRDLYIGMLEHSATLFGRLISGLTEPDCLPAVFHCHAGKDRTGMVAALLLIALGVDRETVLDDYELTRRYRKFEHQTDSFERLVGIGLSPEAAAGVLTAPRWAMSDALDALDGSYGGIEPYLTGPAAMTTSDLERLRDLLTE